MDLQLQIPGLLISSNAAQSQPFLRGVGGANVGIGTEASIATFVDGVNLTRNAFEGMSARHAVDPDYAPVLRLWTRFLQDRVLIGIMDNGQGIQPDLMKSVFDPFFTTRPPDSNHIGLGLSIAEAVAKAHGGALLLGRSSQGGLEATFALPRGDAVGVTPRQLASAAE